MTLDSSALVAIVFGESGYLEFVDRMLEAPHVRIGAPSLVETGLVVSGRNRRSNGDEVDALIEELAVAVVPFGQAERRIAVDAFRRYGRGRHKAALNFGDCLAYATAMQARDSLLFVGDDFAKTDVPNALADRRTPR